MTGSRGISYGMMWSTSQYDGSLYTFGKGETLTEVSISQDVIPGGSAALITGRVTDQSPGAPGVPVVSKESMTAYMEYLYNNKPLPMDVKGVPVSLVAITTDGGVTDLGSVTTNADGYFYYMWEPTEDEVVYTIVANFAGDDAYYASYGEAGLAVTETPSPAGPIEPEEPTEAPFITTEIAIIVAVVIVAVIAIVGYWVLRKRK